MGKKVIDSVNYMNNGYSCSQAILCAFCDEVDMTLSQAAKASQPYAGGAHIKCGAVLAAEMVLNYIKSDKKNIYPFDIAEKSVQIIERFEQEFLEKNTTVICRELRGGFDKPKLRSCVGCVEDAAAILERVI